MRHIKITHDTTLSDSIILSYVREVLDGGGTFHLPWSRVAILGDVKIHVDKMDGVDCYHITPLSAPRHSTERNRITYNNTQQNDIPHN